MVELVDTLGLGSNSILRVGVQVPFSIILWFIQVHSSVVEQQTFNLNALGSIPSVLKVFKFTLAFLAQLDRAIAF